MRIGFFSEYSEIHKYCFDIMKNENFKACHFKSNNRKFKSDHILVKEIDVKEQEDYILKNFDLIISVNFGQIFSKKIVSSIRSVNVHPGYIPDTRGSFSHQFAILYKYKTGITIHEMDDKIDMGKLIIRKEIVIEENDTSLTLYKKLMNLQKKLLKRHLIDIIKNKYKLTKIVGNGNCFKKEDAKKLFKIDLNKKITAKEFIDFARAFSHPPHKNIYFLDKENKKIFLNLILEKEV